jgi:hypothetical protein
MLSCRPSLSRCADLQLVLGTEGALLSEELQCVVLHIESVTMLQLDTFFCVVSVLSGKRVVVVLRAVHAALCGFCVL